MNRLLLATAGALALGVALPAITLADTPSERDIREYSVLGERLQSQEPLGPVAAPPGAARTPTPPHHAPDRRSAPSQP